MTSNNIDDDDDIDKFDGTDNTDLQNSNGSNSDYNLQPWTSLDNSIKYRSLIYLKS